MICLILLINKIEKNILTVSTINNSHYLMNLKLLVEIFDDVDYTDIVNLSEVCKQFYDIITNFSWDQLCVIERMNMPS